MPIVFSIAILVLCFCGGTLAEETFRVADVFPGHKTQGIELEPLIQIHVSESYDSATISNDAVKLFRLPKRQRVAVNISGDLGGVINVSVEEPLHATTEYELAVTSAIKSRGGAEIEPLKIRFRTTDESSQPLRDDIADFRFAKQRIDQRNGVCGLALHNDMLFACTWDGKLIAYALSAHGTLVEKPRVLLQRKRRFNAIAIDPASTKYHTVLWLSHDSQFELSLGPNDFSGTITKVELDSSTTEAEPTLSDVVVGLPTGDHPASGLTFGPDGRLYVSQGALSMLGGKPEVPETPLSAATLAIELRDPLFRSHNPVDVRGFDAHTKPTAIQVFATGIREAFDLCWHSSGSLFAGVNMNDTKEKSPSRSGLPAVNARPSEMMLRIVQGRYYGHPNPSRDEWVLLGGNPTSDVDPWEVADLPVGTRPESNFDPSLLIRNLEQDKGPSADGVCEWTSEGPLNGRLLFCFYTATRGVHSYKVIENGTKVDDHQPLVGADNRVLRFGAPLDIVHHPRGWLYVADFSAPQRGDSGRSGGVWLVKRSQEFRAQKRTPELPEVGTVLFSDSFDESSRGKRIRNTVSDPEPRGLGYRTDTPFGHTLRRWFIADPDAKNNKRAFWCVPEETVGNPKSFASQAGRSRNSIAFANVAVPNHASDYTICFRQWCNDNDYIGFVVGASEPAFRHNGVEFGYTRQLPGTDTTVKDAYLQSGLGEKMVKGAALRKQWVQHRIEVTPRVIRWFQNERLIATGENTDKHPGGYFGIRHRFERGTRYDDVEITTKSKR